MTVRTGDAPAVANGFEHSAPKASDIQMPPP
jgi:hypothetical protein